MRRRTTRRRLALALLLVAGAIGCRESRQPAEQAGDGVDKTAPAVRAARRAYDGAPPIVPHAEFGMTCLECHNERGRAVEGVGFAPPSPHESTAGLSAISHCRQCHVSQQVDASWRENDFAGLAQDLRPGRRHSPGAPPTIPHPVFLRESCTACHTGPAAREPIRTSHPERVRCRQCHVEPQTAAAAFRSETG